MIAEPRPTTVAPAAGRMRDVGIVGLVALLARLVIVLATPSLQAGDMDGWEQTARRVTLEGIGAGYATLDPGSLYPPAFFYPLWVAGQLYRACCSPEFATGSTTLDVVMRLAPILADSLLAILVYVLARTWTDPRRARWAGLLYALCPAVLVSVAQQGMIGDPYMAVLILFGLLSALHRRAALSAFCLTLAVLTKPQAVALVPLGVAVQLQYSSPRQRLAALMAAALAVLAALVPFVLNGTLADVWAAIGAMAGLHAYTQNSADNIWRLLPVWRRSDVVVGPFGEVPDEMLLLPGLSFRDAGLLAVAVLQLTVLVRLRRSVTGRDVAAAAAVLSLGCFFLATRMHVNYAFLAFPFLCALAGTGSSRLRLVLVLVTLACLINWQDGVPWAVHRVNALIYGASLGVLVYAWIGPATLRLPVARRAASAIGCRGGSP